jgi:threonine aldolase
MIVGMQFDVLLRDGLYQELGRHCDELGKKLADGIKAKGYELAYEQESNMVFPIFTYEKVKELAEKVMFEEWEDRFDGTMVIRLVTSWVSSEDEVNAFLELI